ncbi:MAG: cyclic 2,3-diphosphoglycerate synthase [Candidatus Micrarchaeia archaeon]
MRRVLILGAGGRDFHNFNVLFRNNPNYKVVGFTAAQIPFISDRIYPKELAGELYPNGIKIFSEEKLGELIKKLKVDECILSYSDLSYKEIFEKACVCNENGADFVLVAPKATMLKSKKKVIAVCASRTGAGKSEVSRYITKILKKEKKKFVVVRHPMPYGNLKEQIIQRFEKLEDLEKNKCTIEEREEYEPHIKIGNVVYAGVDYEKILREAEKEAEIILWDGGNNDLSFFEPNLLITVVDPLRSGNEISYYPGELAVRMADIVVVNKVNVAKKEDIERVVENIKRINKNKEKSKIVFTESIVSVDNPNLIKGKRVIVVEDGPSVTHGEMGFGAASIAAEQFGAKEIVDPRPFAVGTIKEAYSKFKHLKNVVPALGYSKKQILELEATLNKADCDSIVSSTIDLRRILNLNKPLAQVSFEIKEEKELSKYIKEFL